MEADRIAEYEREIFHKFKIQPSDGKSLGGEQLGVSAKYERSLYDNERAKREAIRDAFQEGKISKDPYTSTLLHLDAQAAKNKYGLNKETLHKHIVEPDHINPIQKVHAKYGNNPFLTDEDIKKIANMKANLRPISKTINNSKLNKTNVEYVHSQLTKTVNWQGDFKKAIKFQGGSIKFDLQKIVRLNGKKAKINLLQGSKMIGDQMQATFNQNLYAAGLTGKNIAQSGLRGIQQDQGNIMIGMSIQAIQELQLVAQGKKTWKEASKDLGKCGAKLTMNSGLRNIAADGMISLTKKSSSSILKTTSKLLKNNNVCAAMTLGVLVADAAIDFVNGDISGEEFMTKGMVNTAEFFAMKTLPVGSMMLGAAVVPTVLATMVITIACNYLISQYMNYKNQLQAIDQRVVQVNAIADAALKEISYQREILKALIMEETQHWDNVTETAFQGMYEGTLFNNVEQVAEGLDDILGLFGENVRFKNVEVVKQSILAKETFVF